MVTRMRWVSQATTTSINMQGPSSATKKMWLVPSKNNLPMLSNNRVKCRLQPNNQSKILYKSKISNNNHQCTIKKNSTRPGIKCVPQRNPVVSRATWHWMRFNTKKSSSRSRRSVRDSILRISSYACSLYTPLTLKSMRNRRRMRKRPRIDGCTRSLYLRMGRYRILSRWG